MRVGVWACCEHSARVKGLGVPRLKTLRLKTDP